MKTSASVSYSGPGQVVVSFEFSRYTGPRFVHGAVRLRFDSRRPYSFESRVRWPASDNYEAEIRREVEAVLREHLGSLDSCEVVLEDITWDQVASCAAGFARAARAATEMAFVVLTCMASNNRWRGP
jgi:hypothetical protein